MSKNTVVITNHSKRHNISIHIGVIIGVILIICLALIYYYFSDIKAFFIELKNDNDIISYSNDVNLLSRTKKEVFNIDQNAFTYDESKVACEALNAKLATKTQMEKAYADGANWCNNGWVEDQLAMWPIQEGYLKTLENTELDGKCGQPGLNGGYQPDKNLKLSANCYGYKPKPDEDYIHYLDEIMENTNNEPELIDKYRNLFASKKFYVSPHSDVQWSEFSKYISDYKLDEYRPNNNEDMNQYYTYNNNNGSNSTNNTNNNNNTKIYNELKHLKHLKQKYPDKFAKWLELFQKNAQRLNNYNSNSQINGMSNSKLNDNSGIFNG